MNTEQKLMLAILRYLEDTPTPRGRAGIKARERLTDAIAASRAVCGKKTVRNLMSGEPVEIDIDTPIGCDPSSETYWSM